MKLIGAGLPRTATTSQKIALEMLGLRCYHMSNVLRELPLATTWRRVLDGELPVTDVLDGYETAVDWPGSYYYSELMEAYPEAKVLLSVRSGESWAQSMHDTIWSLFYEDCMMRHLSDARASVDPPWREYLELMKEMWKRTDLMTGADATLASMARACEEYNARVKAAVPADRLLVWSAGDGWDPICDLLELPVPDEPFPHVNDTEGFAQMICGAALSVVSETLKA